MYVCICIIFISISVRPNQKNKQVENESSLSQRIFAFVVGLRPLVAVVVFTASKEEVRRSSTRSEKSVKGWTVHSGGCCSHPVWRWKSVVSSLKAPVGNTLESHFQLVK